MEYRRSLEKELQDLSRFKELRAKETLDEEEQKQTSDLTGRHGNVRVHGGTRLDNVYLFDGIDTTDPVTNTFGANLNADAIEEVEVQKGGVIFEKGEVGDSMYIIIEGRVRVYDGERTIVHLGERDIFGELALLDPEPRFASIAADQDSRLFRLDREAFLELMSGNIEIVRGILHVLCERLRRSVIETGAYVDQTAGDGQP